MKYFTNIAKDLVTHEALRQIEDHPEIWGADPERTSMPNSPHRESLDAWLRFRPRRELTTPASFGEPHFAEFYPAWHKLPGLHAFVFHIMSIVRATYLGGILLTKLPAGKAIYPHIDTGWHPNHNHLKAYFILQANTLCINECEEEAVVLLPGSVWLFENRVTHAVTNDGDTDRIAMIVTMRTT